MREYRTVVPPAPTAPHVIWSWVAVALMPLVLVVGFVVGTALLGDPNDPASPHDWAAAWRVIVLWAGLEIVPGLGLWWAATGAHRHEHGAIVPLVVNAVMVAAVLGLTLVGGLHDAFT